MGSISLLIASPVLAAKETRVGIFSEICNSVAHRALNESQLESEIAPKIKEVLRNKQVSVNEEALILPQILQILKNSAAQAPIIYQFEDESITKIKLENILASHLKPSIKTRGQKIDPSLMALEAKNLAHPSRKEVISRISKAFADKSFLSNTMYKEVQKTLKSLVEEKKITPFEQLPYIQTLFEALKECAQASPQSKL